MKPELIEKEKNLAQNATDQPSITELLSSMTKQIEELTVKLDVLRSFVVERHGDFDEWLAANEPRLRQELASRLTDASQEPRQRTL